MKSIAKNSIFNSCYTILSLLFPLISSMYVARVLRTDGVGQVAYAQNIVSYFVTLSVLGLPSHGVREIAKVQHDKIQMNKIFTELFTINATSTTIALILFCGLVVFDKQITDYPLFFASGLLIFFNYFNIDWFYQGKEEYTYIVLRSFVVKLISFVALFLLIKSRNDYVKYALITSLATGGNYLFNVYHARKTVALDFSGINIQRHIKPLAILAISLFLSTIYGKVDVTMIGKLTTNDNVGYYSYAQKIIAICVTLSTSISTVFLPRLSFYYKNNNRDAFLELVNKGVAAVAFISIPLSFGLFSLAPELMEVLFGYEFLPSSLTIRFLVPIILIQSFGNLLCYQLVLCTGNEKKRLPAYILGTISNVLLNYGLIQVLQHNGAAIASVIAESIVNGVQFIQIKKELNFKLQLSPVLWAILNATAMSLLILIIKSFLSEPFTVIILSFISGCVLYILLIALEKNDILYLIIDKLKMRGK